MDSKTNTISDAFWSLCHGPDQVRIDGLHLVQVQALVKAFAPKNIESWFVWFEGADDWIPLAERLPLITGPEMDHLTPTPMPLPTEPEIVTVTNTKVPHKEVRQMPRFQMKMEAIIEFKGKLLKTSTLDVSLAGMRIEDGMPFPVDSVVMVTLRYKGSELVMNCKILESKGKPTHHRLLIQNCNRMEVLRSWIVGDPHKA